MYHIILILFNILGVFAFIYRASVKGWTNAFAMVGNIIIMIFALLLSTLSITAPEEYQILSSASSINAMHIVVSMSSLFVNKNRKSMVSNNKKLKIKMKLLEGFAYIALLYTLLLAISQYWKVVGFFCISNAIIAVGMIGLNCVMEWINTSKMIENNQASTQN